MSDLKKLVSEKESYSSAENQKLAGFSHDDTKRLERVVWRKLDMFILPVVAMFYLLSFLVSLSLRAHVMGGFMLLLYMSVNRTEPILGTQKSQDYKKI